MKTIDLKQGSPEWLTFRRSHIGASDCSSIMDVNPFKCERKVWEEKVLGLNEPVNKKMKDGQKNEEKARECYVAMTGIDVNPCVAESTVYPFISASFDGMTKNQNHIVEIKCGKSSHKLAQIGVIPMYYEAQMHHQLYVAGLNEMDYFSYSEGEGIVLKFYRDENFITNMLDKYKIFWKSVLDGKYEEIIR